jgi:DNA polymerase III subunit beta
MPWAELPPMIEISDVTGTVELGAADFNELMSPLSAVGVEATRFYLCGIHWQSVGGRLISTATNGVRLLTTSIPAGKFSEGRRDCIIPREAAAILERLVRTTKPTTLTMRRSKQLIAVNCEDFSFVSKLIDAEYPDCGPAIPPPSDNWAIVDRVLLAEAVEALDFAGTITPGTPLLLLHFGASQIIYMSLAREPENGRDHLAAETSGAAHAVVDLLQLVDLLGELRGERVRLDFNEGRSLRISGDGAKLAVLAQCNWDVESEIRSTSARPDATPIAAGASENRG